MTRPKLNFHDVDRSVVDAADRASEHDLVRHSKHDPQVEAFVRPLLHHKKMYAPVYDSRYTHLYSEEDNDVT